MRQMKAFSANDVADDGYLFFDTETTGLGREDRLVQLAWILCAPDGEEISRNDLLIKPEGFTIPRDATAIHGITTERALADGVPLTDALEKFQQAIGQSEFVVGHNIEFDETFIHGESLRAGLPNRLPLKRRICTMDRSAAYCAIPSSSPYRKYKWPRLAELHRKLFDADFDNAHDASADVEATMRCFWELRKRGVL